MNATIAIFIHTYRELNSKKLFWFAIALSALMVLAFIIFGISTKGLDILGVYYLWEFERPLTEEYVLSIYRDLFNDFAVNWGLGLVAALLALISTAGVFPSMMSDGSIDLVLSRPISRLRLFLTKYLACLLFVFIQLIVFCFVCFLVFGLRLGVWEWGIFVVAPMVLLYFSYIFCVCVLMGVLTRSTIASLIVAGLFWVLLTGLNFGDYQTMRAKVETDASTIITEKGIPLYESNFKALKEAGATWEAPPVETVQFDGWGRAQIDAPKPLPEDSEIENKDEINTANQIYHRQYGQYASLVVTRDTTEGISELLETINRWIVLAKSPLPKTDETLDYSKRALSQLTSLQENPLLALEDESEPSIEGVGNPQGELTREFDRLYRAKLKERYQGRSTFWVLGTSLLFEFVVIALAGFIFHRRDF